MNLIEDLWRKPTNQRNIYKQHGHWYFQRNCRIGGGPLICCGRTRCISFKDAWAEHELDMAYWKDLEDA